jgi:hypothetical protein
MISPPPRVCKLPLDLSQSRSTELGDFLGSVRLLAGWASDTDGNGYIEGRDELFPMYLAAARDFTQPLFAYGPPRLVRLGVEFLF